jgi:hypothetical protein
LINQQRYKSYIIEWDLDRPNKPIRTIPIAQRPAVSLDVKGKVFAVGLADCSLHVYKEYHLFSVFKDAHDVPITGLLVMNKGENIISVSSDGQVKNWKLVANARFGKQGPISIVIGLLFFSLLLAWFVSCAIISPEDLISLRIPYLSFNNGTIKLITNHVPLLKPLGLDALQGL